MNHRGMNNSVLSNTRGLLPRTAGKAAVAAAFLTGSIGAGSLAAADEPTTDELMDQISKLQEQVQQIKASETAAKAESETDALTRVLDDAEKRSSRPAFLQESDPDPFTAGHDGKFVLRSPDGMFELNPNFQLQVRYVANLNSNGNESFDDYSDGFEIRRAKVGFKGHAFTEDLTYDLKFAFGRDAQISTGSNVALQNAFIDYVPVDGLFKRENLGVRIGQYKDVTFHEESIASSKQLSADRSLVNEILGGGTTDFIQGAGLIWKGERLKSLLAFTDGANSDNTSFNNGDLFGVAGRIDALVIGEDDEPMGDFTALGTDEKTARVGAGFHYTADGSDRAIHHSFDGQYETDQGFGFFASFYGLYAEDGDLDSYHWGALAQASQLIGDDGWEVFGRYDFIVLDDQIALGADSEDFFHEVTAGVNKYWEGHKLKMTVDVVFLPNGTPTGVGGAGILDSVGEFGEQLAIRGQFQLLL